MMGRFRRLNGVIFLNKHNLVILYDTVAEWLRRQTRISFRRVRYLFLSGAQVQILPVSKFSFVFVVHVHLIAVCVADFV